MRRGEPPSLTELRSLLIQIEDITGKLEFITADMFWKRPKFVDPFLQMGHRINEMTRAGALKSHQVKGALWNLCQSNGFYPIRLPKKQMIFVHWEQLLDIRDELLDIYDKENKAKAMKAAATENTTNSAGLIGV